MLGRELSGQGGGKKGKGKGKKGEQERGVSEGEALQLQQVLDEADECTRLVASAMRAVPEAMPAAGE
jgi:hypothetical protein